MTTGTVYLRRIPAILALLASAAALLVGLLRLSSGRDAMGLYWVVVGLLILRGVRASLNPDSKE
jgi:hypothetical protein